MSGKLQAVSCKQTKTACSLQLKAQSYSSVQVCDATDAKCIFQSLAQKNLYFLSGGKSKYCTQCSKTYTFAAAVI